MMSFLLLLTAISLFLVQLVYNPGSIIDLATDFGLVRNQPKKRAWEQRPFALANAANYDLHAATPLLVVRGVGDEASLTMAAGKIGARLNNVLAKYLLAPFAVVTMSTSTVVLTYLHKKGYGSISHGSVLLVQSIVFLVLNILPNFFNAVFGREFLVGAVRCELSSDSVPDGRAASVMTLNSSKTGLRHSLYDDPQSVDIIIQWLERSGVIPRLPS